MVQSIRQSAVAYATILEFMKKHTSPDKPLTLRDINAKLEIYYPNVVKNSQQVHDAMMKYYKKHILHRFRKKLEYYWWFDPNDDKRVEPIAETVVLAPIDTIHAPTVLDEQTAPEIKAAIETNMSIKPEVTITKNKVVIVSEHLKITIEI